MVNDETSDEKRETEVQTGYRNKTHEDSMISDDTPQQDCTCSSIPYDHLNITCTQTTTLEMLDNTDRQRIPVDQTLKDCVAQERVSDDIVLSGCAPVSLSDEPLQIFETKKNQPESTSCYRSARQSHATYTSDVHCSGVCL